ncbi:MAG: CpsD/CapB family tyrosine-protein kinase [Desulfobacterales bacterium]|nr:CpsD/CapB family tyrosine-protein kinase [Desulfobacterales bacterium]
MSAAQKNPEPVQAVSDENEPQADAAAGPADETYENAPEENGQFKWENNVARFPEEDLPFLSKKSVQQLESNFRELMIVEANINALAKSGNTIYVSSCTDGDGKTIAAISTAFALSFYSGKNVLLMDGNHHNPQVHSLFGISESPGFYELCNKSATLEQVILPTQHKGLSIITMGDTGMAGADQDRAGKVLKQLSAHFDYIICDGGSVMTSSLSLRDIVHFSAALLVIECEKTRWEVLQIAEDKIKKSGGPTAIGVVFNRRKYYIPRSVYKLIS